MEDLSEKKVSKNTEKVVASLRIKQIENGIRSISSILDTRTLYELETVERKDLNSAREREKQEKRNNARRGNNLIFSSITNQGAVALELLKEKGVVVNETTDEFGDEERIWKHKYHTPSYTQKRKFENPKLHEYFKHLTTEEQKEFKIQCRETLYKLSSDLRKQHTHLKNEMDSRGVFHPAANAHRAHCMYLLKLYKEIDASSLEDPVLRHINSSHPNSPFIEPINNHLTTSREPVSRPTTSSGLKIREPLVPRAKTPVVEKKKSLFALLNSASAPQLPTVGNNNNNNNINNNNEDKQSNSKPTSKPTTAGGPISNTIASTQTGVKDNNNNNNNNNSNNSNNRTTSGNKPKLTSQNSFNQAQSQNTNNVKPTTADNKKFQKAGAGTIVEAGVGMDGFIEGCSSDWMLQRLQKEQIDGTVNVNTTQMSTPLPRGDGLIWKSIPELNTSDSRRKGPSLGAAESHPIISFNDFQELFQAFVKEAEKEVNDIHAPGDSQTSTADDIVPEDDGKNGLRSDSISHSSNNLPAVNSKSRKDQSGTRSSSRKRRGSITKRQPGDLSYLGPLNDPVSQKIIASHQPHLEAFLNIKTKKKHSLDLVKKMITTLPETSTGKIDVSVRPSTDHHKKNNGSQVGLQAVRAQTAKASLNTLTNNLSSPIRSPSRRKNEGFRNVFKDDDSLLEDKSSSMSLIESQTSLSESDTNESEESSDEDSPKGGKNLRRSGSRSPYRAFVPHRALGKFKKGLSKTEGAQIMQEKQSIIWEILQVPTIDRISIMSKYSSGEYAPVFHDAINHWSIVAILVFIRIELRAVYLKYQRGLTEFPFEYESTLPINHNYLQSENFLFYYIFEKIPVQLRKSFHLENNTFYSASSKSSLSPTFSSNRQSINSIHSISMSKIKNQTNNIEPFKIKTNIQNNNNVNSNNQSEEILINNLFYNVKSYLLPETSENELNEFTRSEVLNYLYKCIKLIDNKLLLELSDIEAKYFDVIPYGNMPCKEWLNSKAQKIKLEKDNNNNKDSNNTKDSTNSKDINKESGSKESGSKDIK